MLEKYYKILNLTEKATDEEVKLAYETLTEKYKAERFEEGEVGNNAAKKLTEIKVAYDAIMDSRVQQFTTESTGALFLEVETALKKGDVTSAQQKLDAFDERNAEWHYLQSVVFYKKNWLNESKKQLEIAVSMEPNVAKYTEALAKMNEAVNRANANAYTSGSTYGTTGATTSTNPFSEEQQLGGGSCIEWCCQMAACNMLLNCCCNCH